MSVLLAIWTSDYLDFWSSGLLAFQPSILLVFQASGLLAFQTSDILDFRTSGLPDFWSSGLLASSLLIFRDSGLLAFQTSGYLDFWPSGLLSWCPKKVLILSCTVCYTNQKFLMSSLAFHGLPSHLRVLTSLVKAPLNKIKWISNVRRWLWLCNH